MTEFNTQSFADLNDVAGNITKQNAIYEVAGAFNRRFAHIPKNEIATEQAEHIELLGLLSDELPYEELALEYSATEREIEASLERLPALDDELCEEKLGAVALATKLTESMPLLKNTVEQNLSARLGQINEQRRLALEQRIEELRDRITELNMVFEIAGQAWPVPAARLIEIEPEPVAYSPNHTNGNGHKPVTQDEIGEIISVAETTTGEPPAEIEHNSIERLEEFRKRYIDQPLASPLIAFYLIENAGSSTTTQGLADFVYEHEAGELRGVSLPRRRIATALGPKTQGWRIKRLLGKEGYELQYGWRIVSHERPEGQRRRTDRLRLYKALPAREGKDNPPLPEFIETVVLSNNGSHAEENIELAAQEQ
jgi:hypothetical protein